MHLICFPMISFLSSGYPMITYSHPVASNSPLNTLVARRLQIHTLTLFPLIPSSIPIMQHNLVVEAMYDCDPDHEDELGFKEGDKIVVTKKLNKDWWVSFSLWVTKGSLLLHYNLIIETSIVNSIIEQMNGTCMYQWSQIRFWSAQVLWSKYHTTLACSCIYVSVVIAI